MKAFVTKVLQVNFQKGRRVIAVSDIHAHLSVLKMLLEKIEFCHEDYLVIVGDFLEKGPESLEMLRFIMELSKKDNVYISVGNVDLVFLGMCFENENSKDGYDFLLFQRKIGNKSTYEQMAEEAGISINSYEDFVDSQPVIREKFKEAIEFVSSLPTIIEEERFIFVHGGITTNKPKELEGQPAIPFLKREAFYNEGYISERYMVVGHFPATLFRSDEMNNNSLIDYNRKIICIDGGCGIKRDGQINALIADTEAMTFKNISCNGMKKVKALDTQKDQKASFIFKYPNWEIKIIEDRGEFFLVENYQGQRHEIPRSYIYWIGGKTYANDYSNGRLEVEAGEILAVNCETAKGCWAVKDGIGGWYEGRIEEI